MKAITQHQFQQGNSYRSTVPHFSLTATWNKFIAFAARQEDNRFAWTAFSLFGHGTFFTIATLTTVMLTGNSFALLAATCLTMAMVLIVNLAALPTKIIIPVFFISLLADIAIMATALALWFD